MDYFDDLNPYLVKEDDNENLTRQHMLKISYVLTLVKKEHSILVIPVPKHGMIRFIQEHCNKLVEIILLS